MTRTKEIGYDLINVIWRNIDDFEKLWNRTDVETKDKIVNGVGELAVKLANSIDTSVKEVLHIQNVRKCCNAMCDNDAIGESVYCEFHGSL